MLLDYNKDLQFSNTTIGKGGTAKILSAILLNPSAIARNFNIRNVAVKRFIGTIIKND
jgi:hypothetical protein